MDSQHRFRSSLLVRLACALASVLINYALEPAHLALAQTADSSSGMDEIESLFTKEEDSSETPSPSPPPGTAKQDSTADAKQGEIKEVSDLSKLQSFNDVAVIQKRFLPKTSRWEFFLAPTLNLNDAFFINIGATARFGYYFRERYGIEGIAVFLSSSKRQVIDDLHDKRGVDTQSFITPTGYCGADFKWTPIYGKMTWANRKITPFDLYFSWGLGLTNTNQSGSEPTLHAGTGQIFALSKSGAVRWDFSWFMFTAASSVDPSGTRSLYHNLLFSIGWSWFFPEATYR